MRTSTDPLKDLPTSVIESLMEQARISRAKQGNEAQLQAMQQGKEEDAYCSRQLLEEFLGAVRHVNEPRPGAVEFPEATQCRLFGLFAIAQKGPPPRVPPAGVGEAQHQVWCMTYASFGPEGITMEDAMRQYIELVEEADPSFLFDDDDEGEAAAATPPPGRATSAGGGSIFDAIREGRPVAPFLPAHANAVDEESGLSALHLAVDTENEGAVESLLAARALPDAVDPQRSTPLHYAALLGSASLVNLLLGAGSDPAVVDDDGKTPSTLAQREGHKEIAKKLLEALAAPAVSEGLLPGRLPTVDLAAWLHGDTDTREALALAFDEAFQNWGFCSVRGYEELLPEAVITEARTQAEQFFMLTVEEKRRLARVDGVVGYLGPGEETVSDSLVGAEAKVGKAQDDPTAKPPVKAAADPVESLNLPAYQEAGITWEAAAAAASCPWRAATYLPTSPTGFGPAAVAYFEGATKLMLELNQLMEAALNLPRNLMHAPFERPGTLLRFAYYPPQPPNGGAAFATAPGLRYGEHTDYDGFTILQRDGDDGLSGGLEIELSDGTWAPVPSLPGHLTINVGDLFARWTNDRWRATRHRVTLPKGAAAAAGRLSVVYFTGPHPDTVVSCLPSTKCKRLNGGPQYPPIKAGDHVRMKMLAATAAAREGTANGEGGTLV